MEGAKAVSLAFRIVALGLSVAAAVVMGSVVSYGDYSALVYFMVGSIISAVCAALALYLFVNGGGSGTGALAILLLDAAAQAILFSAAGAAIAMGRCFVGRVDTFGGRASTAMAIGVCAATAVTVAALTRDPPSESFSCSFCE